MIDCAGPGTLYVMVSNPCSCTCDTSWEAVCQVTVTISNADCEAGLEDPCELLAAFEKKEQHVEGEDVRPVFLREADRLVTGRNRERPLQLQSTYG
jgi:hypothetical protein